MWVVPSDMSAPTLHIQMNVSNFVEMVDVLEPKSVMMETPMTTMVVQLTAEVFQSTGLASGSSRETMILVWNALPIMCQDRNKEAALPEGSHQTCIL